MSNDQERAKFEAWASKCFDWSPKGVATDQTQSGGYHDRELMLCWTAWQAARADLVGDAALLREALEALEDTHKFISVAGEHLHGARQECCGNYGSGYGAAYMGDREVIPMCCEHPVDLSDHASNELRVLESAIARLRAALEGKEKP